MGFCALGSIEDHPVEEDLIWGLHPIPHCGSFGHRRLEGIWVATSKRSRRTTPALRSVGYEPEACERTLRWARGIPDGCHTKSSLLLDSMRGAQCVSPIRRLYEPEAPPVCFGVLLGFNVRVRARRTVSTRPRRPCPLLLRFKVTMASGASSSGPMDRRSGALTETRAR